MLDRILSATGALAAFVPNAVGMSDAYCDFLKRGYRCGQCNARLLNALGLVTAKAYAADGRELASWAGGVLRADTLVCPYCNNRWKVWGQTPAPEPASLAPVTIVETERSEEFFGEDRRVIDNLLSSSTPTRSFRFTKEWTKTLTIELEKLVTSGGTLSLGAKDVAALQLSSEAKLRQAYTVAEQSKETFGEDVTCVAPAHRKLTVIVRWKRIWQHGFIETALAGQPVRLPFRVAVGVTFDQQEIEDEAPAPAQSLPLQPAIGEAQPPDAISEGQPA